MNIGEKAPNFSVPNENGKIINLDDYLGQALVLFFYPRDDTSGCTKEAIEFSHQLDAFTKLGAVILGVSKDSPKSHQKFITKHNLTVSLLSDETTTMCKDYGVWKEKSMYGKKFMGIERSTFVIDKTGNLSEVWCKVKVPGHVDAVLEKVQAL